MSLDTEDSIDQAMGWGSNPIRDPTLKKAHRITINLSTTMVTITQGITSNILGTALTTPVSFETRGGVDILMAQAYFMNVFVMQARLGNS